MQFGFWPGPAANGGLYRDNVNAFDRAGGDAEITAGAFIFYDSVHLLGGPENSVDRAGLYAQGAAYADLFVNYHHGFLGVLAMFGV